MTKKLAFAIVLFELSKNPLFRGHYNAKMGKPEFIDGVSAVMESIAYSINGHIGDTFSDIFDKNILKSEKNA